MIRAALFDLDGTLLDSNHVWARVDELFFSARNIPIPADYARAISGMSFFATAAYTKERFSLPESAEEIVREWTEMTTYEYAARVALKPGSAGRSLLSSEAFSFLVGSGVGGVARGTSFAFCLPSYKIFLFPLYNGCHQTVISGD